MDDLNDKIRELVRQIVALVHPLEIILFGSAARDEAGPDSDVDLLVVMPDGTQRRQTAQKIYRQVNRVGVPFDVLVATRADLEKHKDNIGLVYRSILREGKGIYAA
jgi:predicted nucleotidyltransferase